MENIANDLLAFVPGRANANCPLAATGLKAASLQPISARPAVIKTQGDAS